MTRDRRPVVLSVAAAALALLWSLPAQAQLDRSRCASCHVANPYTEPAGEHLHDWDRSPHGRSDVGCERCHGGDSQTFESFLAHRDVLNSANPASPVHRTRIPSPCGTCHAGPYTAYQQSRHFALLQDGDRRVPVCTTCHDSVGAHLLSPRALEQQCESCHDADGVAPRPGRAAEARAMLEGIEDVRASLHVAEELIQRVDEGPRRTELDAAYEQAEVPIIQAQRAGHRFVFDQLEARLATARRRVADLLSRLANPSP